MDKELLQGKVYISKDLNLYYYYFDDEKEEVDCKSLGFFEIMCYLGEPIEIEEGFTLRNYFELIDYYQALQMLDMFFKCSLEEFKNCPKEGCRDSEIDYIVINKNIIYESAHTIEPTKNLVEIDNLLSDDGLIHIDELIDDTIEVNGYNKEENQFYGIDLSSLSQLLDYEIVIGNKRLFFDYHEYVVDENNMTLFNFVKSIIWELTFYGCEENRNSFKKYLSQCIKDLGKNIDNK